MESKGSMERVIELTEAIFTLMDLLSVDGSRSI